MVMMTGVANRHGSEDLGEGVVSVGDWWMEVEMSVIDVGEATVVQIGKTPPSPEPS
jgi:hypothetical protein